MKREMIIFALGPVQSYIMTARRTQDFAFGSKLLSRLMRFALEAAVNGGGKPVFPVQVDEQWPESLPNRCVVLAPAETVDLPQQMEVASRGEWKRVADEVKEYFARLAPTSTHWATTWDRQVAGWLEVYWVAQTWDDQAVPYGAMYQALSRAMDSRKLLRHYTSQPELGLKCSLSGTQAALGERDFWDQVRARLAPSFPQRDGVGALATSGGFWVRSNEHLGAVATIKRLAPHRKAAQISVATFPSTGSIASTDFRAEVLLRWDALKVPATEFLNVLDSLGVRDLFTTEIGDELEVLAGDDEVRNRWLRYDGETLYPDFFEPRSLADSLGRKASDVDQGLARRARSMLLELYSLSETEPDAYYAILAMDGDRMGQMLSQLVGGDGVDQHERISGALARLAQGLVWDLVRNHRGQLIYAGGDDVLAFVPTRYALKLARALRLAFGEALAAVDVADRTASVGIAIVHHASPLDGALRLAYGAEQVAKGSFERDALVVRLARRSGEMREVGLRWPDVIGNNGLELVLERSLAAAGRLSSKMAYDLYQEASALARTPEAWRPEIGRLLRRHVDLSAFQRESDEFGAEVSAIEALAEKLAQLAVAWPARNGRSGIEQLAEWLLVLRFAAQREAL